MKVSAVFEFSGTAAACQRDTRRHLGWGSWSGVKVPDSVNQPSPTSKSAVLSDRDPGNGLLKLSEVLHFSDGNASKKHRGNRSVPKRLALKAPVESSPVLAMVA